MLESKLVRKIQEVNQTFLFEIFISGVVTTTRITHATPASLYAYSANRNWESDSEDVYPNPECNDDIAKQLVEGDGQLLNVRKCMTFYVSMFYNAAHLQVIMGGGRRAFKKPDKNGNRREMDLTEEYLKLKERSGQSYRYLETADDLRKWSADGMTDYVMGAREKFNVDFLKNKCLLRSLFFITHEVHD